MNQDHYVNRMVGLCRKWRVECEGKHLKCSGDENGLQISVQTIQLQLQKGKRKQRPFIDVVNVGHGTINPLFRPKSCKSICLNSMLIMMECWTLRSLNWQ